MKPLYTLIVYKSDSDDYCMSCRMDSYSSNFQFEPNLNRDELVEKLIVNEYNNQHLRSSECSYNYIIMKDGVIIYNNIDNCTFNTGYSYPYTLRHQESEDGFYEGLAEAERMDQEGLNEAEALIAEATKVAKEKIAEEEATKKRVEELEVKAREYRHQQSKIRQKQEALDKIDREQYEQLKKKFEGIVQ